MKLTTAQMAEKFGVSHRTLRHYDSINILNPERIGTKRLFTEADQLAMHLIQHGKALGLELTEIRDCMSPDRATLTIQTDLALDLRLKAEYALLDAQSLTRKLQDVIPPTMTKPYRYAPEVEP